MTKTKKLNKIIPAVLLSGAMVISTPNLISPIIANALENNNCTDEACSLHFKFYSNEDYKQPIYVSEHNHSTNEVTITPDNNGEGKDDIIIKGSSNVTDLTVDISEVTNAAKSRANSNEELKVQFFINGDEQPIYVVDENGKHVKDVIVDDDQQQYAVINGLSGVNNLEIKVSEK